MEYTILFIGAGKMATAMAMSLAENFPKNKIKAYDISQENAEKFKQSTGISIVNNLETGLDFANLIVLAVKPQNFFELFESLKDNAKDKLIISIMAGIKISSIQKKSLSRRIIRVMPNTPAIVRKAVCAYAVSPDVTKEDIAIAEKLFKSIGITVKVDENMLDAVTALSGSGPAYVFEFIEAMAKAGEKIGLSYDTALMLSIETVEGAVSLLKKSSLPPEQLKNNVTSPGGTTARALEVFSQHKFRDLIYSALLAAKERSIELGKKYEV
ncbi:MAG TPA: pyrroline-5-carboxylate reductase [Victivallales bacterium]|nr:pyrroline-5-carboxylate reductase [Victivallales bacterium]HPO90423.1 pyrroline-5-carboxylate reductase [Victivallales bacterium]